jgi:hypothetical protein
MGWATTRNKKPQNLFYTTPLPPVKKRRKKDKKKTKTFSRLAVKHQRLTDALHRTRKTMFLQKTLERET